MEESSIWDEAKLQEYIINQTEENQELEYKRSGALDKSKKTDITIDVSAMANAVGGTIIYGIAEGSRKNQDDHKPVGLSPIDRTVYSKEWLDQIIGQVQPKMKYKINPIHLSSGPNDYAYVVEIQKAQRAHQALDNKYHRRLNTTTYDMKDFEIRDINNRDVNPDPNLILDSKLFETKSDKQSYNIIIFVENSSHFVNNFQILLELEHFNNSMISVNNTDLNHVQQINAFPPQIRYRSISVLYPEEIQDLSEEIGLRITLDNPAFQHRDKYFIHWKLFADNMLPKSNSINLYDFIKSTYLL
ncbi:MAG: AlbA family DNA-binding domain-containing protein [Candidatus Helarchaeota archaeon]